MLSFFSSSHRKLKNWTHYLIRDWKANCNGIVIESLSERIHNGLKNLIKDNRLLSLDRWRKSCKKKNKLFRTE